MTELFMKLLNMSINAGWLVLTVLLVHIIFRKAPKWLFPVLWSFVGIRLLMPNALESRLSVIPDISGFSASEQPAFCQRFHCSCSLCWNRLVYWYGSNASV